MSRTRRTLSVVAAAGIILAAPSTLRALDSAVPDPGTAFDITVDPNAPGTKVWGFITLAAEVEIGTERAQLCVPEELRNTVPGVWVNNVHAVATMQKGSNLQPFNSNYTDTNIPGALQPLQDCFDNRNKMAAFVKYVIEGIVIPGFFGCGSGSLPSCPPYAVKRISDILPSNKIGFSAILEIELAVK